MGVRGSPHRYEFEQVLRKGRGKSDQFSIPNSQFPSEKTVETEPFPRMRIENWELRIGQILRLLHYDSCRQKHLLLSLNLNTSP